MLDTNIGQGYLVRLRLPFDRLGRGAADHLANQRAPLSACRRPLLRRHGSLHVPTIMLPVRHVYGAVAVKQAMIIIATSDG